MFYVYWVGSYAMSYPKFIPDPRDMNSYIAKRDYSRFITLSAF